MKYNNIGSMQQEPESISSNNYFKERSEAAQEIISKKTGFIERWALLIFGSLLLCIAIATWFIKYPDFVIGRAVLLGEFNPSEIVPKQSGRLVSVLVINKQRVRSGEILAWLESDAPFLEVMILSGQLNKSIQLVEKNNSSLILSVFDTTRHPRLGEFEGRYRTVINKLQGASIVSSGLKEEIYSLKNEIDNWINRYSLRSPADGQVEFIDPIQQSNFVEQGRLLGYIIPVNVHYFAKVKFSQTNFGKIDTGMNVQLRIDAYPYRETGYVSGRLIDLANIAVDSAFNGTILLDKGLITNQDKVIPFKAGLQAEAVIITKETRLLQRLYYYFLK